MKAIIIRCTICNGEWDSDCDPCACTCIDAPFEAWVLVEYERETNGKV